MLFALLPFSLLSVFVIVLLCRKGICAHRVSIDFVLTFVLTVSSLSSNRLTRRAADGSKRAVVCKLVLQPLPPVASE